MTQERNRQKSQEYKKFNKKIGKKRNELINNDIRDNNTARIEKNKNMKCEKP